MIRPTAIADLDLCERELDRALADLRRLQADPQQNLLAQASTEYRIGALRRRRETLAWS